MSGDEVWRCSICKKVKGLSGPHLAGKTSVRSDCWPCAKKQLFLRGPSSTGNGNNNNKSNSSSANPPQKGTSGAGGLWAAAGGGAAAAAAAAARDPVPTVGVAPFMFTPVSSAPPPAAPTAKAASPDGKRKSNANSSNNDNNNPFLSDSTAHSVGAFASAFRAVDTSRSAAVPPPAAPAPALQFSSVASSPLQGSGPRVVMESAAGNSPPFTFKAAGASPFPTADAAAPKAAPAGRPGRPGRGGFADPLQMLPASTRTTEKGTAAPAADLVWVCSVCQKSKDLQGDHLRGKTSVRSDCWPCAKKQLFLLVNRAELSRRSPSARSAAAAASGRSAAAGSTVSPLMRSGAFMATTPASSSSSPFVLPGTPSQSPLTASEAIHCAASSPSPRQQQQQHTREGGNAGEEGESLLRAPAPPQVGTAHWCAPVIPPNEAVTDFYLLLEVDDLSPVNILDGVEIPPTAAAATTAATAAAATVPSVTIAQTLQARFSDQLLRTFRSRVVRDGVPLRAAWHANTLYVIAEEPPSHVLDALAAPQDGHGPQQHLQQALHAFELLGRFAAILLCVENKLAASRFRHIRRLFCASPFSFAACCYYAAQFNSSSTTATPPDEERAAAAAGGGGGADGNKGRPVSHPLSVYGPQPDPTRAPTLWGRVVGRCACAVPRVVSEEHRVRAAKELFSDVGWLTMPAHTTSAAIRLALEEEEEEEKKGKRKKEKDSTSARPAVEEAGSDGDSSDAADVVFLPSTVRLEDLPQAAALALPAKQF